MSWTLHDVHDASIGHRADDEVGLLRELVEHLVGRRAGSTWACAAITTESTLNSFFTPSTIRLSRWSALPLLLSSTPRRMPCAPARALRLGRLRCGDRRFGYDYFMKTFGLISGPSVEPGARGCNDLPPFFESVFISPQFLRRALKRVEPRAGERSRCRRSASPSAVSLLKRLHDLLGVAGRSEQPVPRLKPVARHAASAIVGIWGAAGQRFAVVTAKSPAACRFDVAAAPVILLEMTTPGPPMKIGHRRPPPL